MGDQIAARRSSKAGGGNLDELERETRDKRNILWRGHPSKPSATLRLKGCLSGELSSKK
jgi:hypothetical protein